MGDGPRVLRPDREQLYWDKVDLESQIEGDHLARVIWAFVEGLDLSELYGSIRSRDDVAGRPRADPRVLLAVWLYATSEGIGSARALERLCRNHAAYRWLCGGVPVNYHGLSDFRRAHGDLLDRILTESVASLAAAGLIDLDEVAVDGTKVGANASKSSFRDEGGLEGFAQAARQRIERLRFEVDDDPGSSERRRRAARERAARTVTERAAAAGRKLAELRKEKTRRKRTHPQEEAEKAESRASTSDPDARMMLTRSGFRPAYNLLLSATTRSQIILGLRVSDRRNDTGIAQPMMENLRQRYGYMPKRLLIDTKAATRQDIVALADDPTDPVTTYTPPPPDKPSASLQSIRKRLRRRSREPVVIQEWRRRMASLDGRVVYNRRRHIETINAQIKNRGLHRFILRGIENVRCEALLHAIAHNLRRAASLGFAWA